MIAIDLGSNTIRFVEYDGVQWGRSFEKIVKTAESLSKTGMITENAQKRIVTAITEAQQVMDFNGQPIAAYTTAAMRLAQNADAVLEAIFQQTGVRFKIIDAQTEAKMTLEAVRYRLQVLGLEPSSFVMADIGGGSTELITFSDDVSDSISINQGIVTLYESAESDDDLLKRIEAFQTLIQDMVSPAKDATLVLTAGTPTTISAYLLGMDYETYDPAKINGFVLNLDECIRVYRELLDMDESRRVRYVGVGRERLIGAGILMVTAVYNALGFEQAIIIDDSLREGIALDFFNKEGKESA